MDGHKNAFQCINNQLFQLSLVAIIAAGLIFSSCNRERDVKSSLADIETYIDEHPDSALKAINAIDTNYIKCRSVKAKYALLKSIALDKNYIDTTDTSIIAPAVEYYRHHGNEYDKLRTLYYYGRVQYNAEDFDNAIVTYTSALPLAEKQNGTYCGSLYGAISDTYGMTYNDVESLNYSQKAYDFFKSAGDTNRVRMALYMESLSNMNLKHYKSADSLFKLLISYKDLSVGMKARTYAIMAY